MTAPESTGEHSPSLAERVARARHAATFQTMGWMAWDDAPLPYRSDALRLAREHLDAMEAAGLAVVDLPEPIEVTDDHVTWRGATLELIAPGVTSIWPSVPEDQAGWDDASSYVREVIVPSLIAAALWAERLRAERQGGDPR